MRTRLVLGMFAGLGMLLSGGCGQKSGPTRIGVSGVVDRSTEPLVNGTITFLPAKEHKGPAANGVIQNGKFEIPEDEGPTAGPHQVLINLTPGKMTAEFAAGMKKSKSSRTQWEFPVEVSSAQADFDFVLKDDE